MLLTQGLFVLCERLLAPRFDARQKRAADEIEAETDIIIAGHGWVGGIVTRILRGFGYATTAIDHSAEHSSSSRPSAGGSISGDSTRPDLLDAAGIAKARLPVIAIEDKARTADLVS